MTDVPTSDRSKIRKAFRLLRTEGYMARMNFMCCQSCAWYELSTNEDGSEKTEAELKALKVVFFHEQDNESFQGDRIARTLHLRWAGKKKEIKRVLRPYFGDRLIVPKNKRETFQIEPDPFR